MVLFMATSKISITVLSGSLERLQMAAMVASVGAVSGNQVIVFVSMNALQYFVRGSDSSAPLEGSFGEVMSNKNIPSFKSLFESAVELGEAQIFPCSMAMDVLDIGAEDLESYFSEPLGLTKFLSIATDSQVWTF